MLELLITACAYILLQSLSYWNMHEYLKRLLAERAAADEPVMVILDSFEKFALETGSSKQLLLYNLLDWLQVCHEISIAF